MPPFHNRQRLRAVAFGAVLAAAAMVPLLDIAAQELAGWQVELGTDQPRFATIRPATSSLNLDALVLNCHDAGDATVVQLELYASDAYLLPAGVQPTDLREHPRIRAIVDGKFLPVALFMADDYSVVADTVVARSPALSEKFLDALQDGRELVLQFDLVAKPGDRVPQYDAEASVDLRAGIGGKAVADVRRCVTPDQGRPSRLP